MIFARHDIIKLNRLGFDIRKRVEELTEYLFADNEAEFD